jgi:hypothetical protein
MSKASAKMSMGADKAATREDSKGYKRVIDNFCKGDKDGERRIACLIKKGHFKNPGQHLEARLPASATKNDKIPAASVIKFLVEADGNGLTAANYETANDNADGHDAHRVMYMVCDQEGNDRRASHDSRSASEWNDAQMVQYHAAPGANLLQSIHMNNGAIDWFRSGFCEKMDGRNFRNKLTGRTRKLAAALPNDAEITDAWDKNKAKVKWVTAEGLDAAIDLEALFRLPQRQVPA